MYARILLVFSLIGSTVALADSAEEWWAWRGPTLNGIAPADQQPPTEWSASENVIWKTKVPGRGHSSPIVVGDRIILTTADEQRQTQSVLCYDRGTGKQRWATEINRGGFSPEIHAKNTHATPTAASNGEQVFVVFNNHNSVQLACLDLEGNEVWKKTAGPFMPQQFKFGYAPSPLLYQDTVIVTADFERSGFVAAFDQKTGKEEWRQTRPSQISFSSPILVPNGRTQQLVMSGAEHVAGYNPDNGKGLWLAKGAAKATCGTVVWEGNMVFASGGYPESETVAVEVNRSNARVVWRNREKCYEQSMLAHDGYLYAINDNGIAFCWRGNDGREMWKTRLGGPVSASPILAGGNIYLSNEGGTTFVFKANPQKFEPLARNQLGNSAFASPTIVADHIYLRVADGRQEWLYAIGQ